jgi:hypothetical protein
MGSPTSATTKNSESRRKGGASRSRGTPTAAIGTFETAYPDGERPSQGPWPSEAPMTGMLGEMAFYYGACWRHYRSAQR